MPSASLSQRDLESLTPETYVWGCCVRDGVHFAYIYGSVGDYLRVTRHDMAGGALHKGAHRTLAEARRMAQECAAELAGFYDGVGSVRALTALAYRTELNRAARAVSPLGYRPLR